MYWRVALICSFLAAVRLAHATDVTTYGAGLKSCKDYSASRDESSPDLVAYTDWLSGYFSGINITSNHRNNFLSQDDLQNAMSWLGEFCGRHPTRRLAEAAWTLIVSEKTGPAAHAVEVSAYGSGYKPCELYVRARGEKSIELNVDRTEFIAWLGGYLSAVNAISLATTNALGGMGLDEAVQWLDGYCGAHEQTPFAAAVRTLISGNGSAEGAGPLANSRTAVTMDAGASTTSTARHTGPRAQ